MAWYVVLHGDVELRVDDGFPRHTHAGGMMGEMAIVGSHSAPPRRSRTGPCRLVPVTEHRFVLPFQDQPSSPCRS